MLTIIDCKCKARLSMIKDIIKVCPRNPKRLTIQGNKEKLILVEN
jgi:hypothetical protein